ncbi:hypothetical protein [Alicyclobacillus macrosporangiidus]|uniref:hypothetical protein n=1 Tax=Alicyclobacillus macrosporangiidus TaxID=392015 RepID=UPI00049559D9|nr:hypothetical protein [Alicyclobacillus macrosporangiidus]
MGTELFTAPNPPFPGWQNPAPNVYTFTLPAQGWWNTLFGGGAMKELANFIANLVMQALAWVMHLAILLAAQFSDPAWVVNPVADKIGTVFQLGYKNVFVRLLPFLVLATALYVVWQFLRAQHTKILTAVVSTALSGALIYVFFFNFAPAFKTVNGLAQAVTAQLGTAVESTGGVQAGTLYDALWDVYVLEPWEAAQFGHASQNLSDFDVSGAAVGQKYTNDQGLQQTISAGDNWVKLFMTNTTEQARQSLLGIMTSVSQPFAHSGWTSQDVQNANPYDNIVFLLVLLLLSIPCLAFLGMMAFLLFALAFMFLLMVFLGIVTVPVAFVPEVGWFVTLRWLREAAGYLLLRLANVVYMASTFALAQIVVGAVAVTGDESSLVLAALTNALVFLAALLFREKVFHAYIRPHVEAVQGIERKGENEARPEAQSGDTREERTADGARRPGRGTLSGRFAAERGATAEGVGMSGIGAAATAARRTGAGATSATGTGAARQKLAAAFATVVDKARNPSRASTWQERAQSRADRLIALERAAHGRTLDALAHGGKLAVKAGRSLYDSASSHPELSDLPPDQGDSPPFETQEPTGYAAATEQDQGPRQFATTPRAHGEARQRRSAVEDDEGQRLSEAFEAAPVTATDTEEERAPRDASPDTSDTHREADAGAGQAAGSAEVHGSEDVSGAARETSNQTEQLAESWAPGQLTGRRPLQPERTMRGGVSVPNRPDAELEDHRLAEGFSMPQANPDTSREPGGREVEHGPEEQQSEQSTRSASRFERQRVTAPTPGRPEADVESHSLAEGFSMPLPDSVPARGAEPREPVRGETTSSDRQESGAAPQASGGESASNSVGSAQQRNSVLHPPPRSGREETERRDHERRGSEAETPRLGDGFGVPGVTGTENAATMQTGRDQSQPDNAQPSNSRNGDEKIRRQSTPRSLPRQQTSTLPPDPRGPRLREPRETRGPREPRVPRPRA